MEITRRFTNEATRLLRQASREIYEELKEAAVNEALLSRGEPIEVTANDVRRARRLFIKRKSSLNPSTETLFMMYGLIGVMMFLGGIIYYYFQHFHFRIENEQIPLVISIAGITLAVISFFGRQYIELFFKFPTKREPFDISEPKTNKKSKHPTQ